MQFPVPFHSIYYSNFIHKKKKELILDIEHGIKNFKINKLENITWDYKNYNIFNLCANRFNICHLKKILLNYIKGFFDEYEINYNYGILFNAWINYHINKDDLLTLHGHDSQFHGYICIDPLQSTTVFKHPVTNEIIFEINNEVGLIYVGCNNQNTFHYVKVNGEMDRPRITLAFNLDILKSSNDPILGNPFISTEVIYL